jgi:hypothetical protein
MAKVRLHVLFILVAAATAGCGGNKLGPSNILTLTIDTFSGTIGPLGTSSHDFRVNYEVGFTDAIVELTSLTRANGSIPPITVGLAFGNTAGGVCTRAPSYQNPASVLNQQVSTNDAPFRNGLFCVQIYDNPAAPTITEPLNYTLTVRHY